MIKLEVSESFTADEGYSLNVLEQLTAAEKARINGLINAGKLPGRWGLEQEQLMNPQAFMVGALQNMLSSDVLPAVPCPLFINVRYDHETIIERAAQLLHEGHVTEIWLDGTEGQVANDPWPDGKPGGCFQGFNFWSDGLRDLGVDGCLIKPTGPAYNTPDEHKQLLALAKEHGWTDVVVIGNSYQLMRIHLGAIRFMMDNNFWLKCYYHVPVVKSWSEDVKGAQGQNDGARFNQQWQEHKRWVEYGCKNHRDLRSLVEGANYFIYGRDAIVGNELTKPLS
jgi:hypothetical protein